MKPTHHTTHTLKVAQGQLPKRADLFLCQELPSYSRTFLRGLIDQHLVTINNKACKASSIVKIDDEICVSIPPLPTIDYTPTPHMAEQLSLHDVKIVFEHPEFLIISKPAGLMVHKASVYTTEATLVDWLLSKWHSLAHVGNQDRPGIVHRLDKDTSGLMIIPRTPFAHFSFSDLFKNRGIHKTYTALVHGHPEKKGSIDLPIDRDPVNRNKMTHARSDGRAALTHYQVADYFNAHTLVNLNPITGRTHQIRVHMSALGHPLVGDFLYGSPSPFIKRQALHATALSFTFQGQPFSFQDPLPKDMAKLIDTLRKSINFNE